MSSSPSIRLARRSGVLAILLCLVAPGRLRADPEASELGQMATREFLGSSLIAGGGVLTFLAVFAGATGGPGPCAEEDDEEEERECFDREAKENRKYERIRLGMAGVGLIGIGTGLWLVKTSPSEPDGAVLLFDGEGVSLSANMSF